MTKNRATIAALVIAMATLAPKVATSPAHADDGAIDIVLKADGFEPAEIKVAADTAFTLHFINDSGAPAEIESNRLHFEKVVAAGGEIVVKVRPMKAGTYEFENEFKPGIEGRVVVGE